MTVGRNFEDGPSTGSGQAAGARCPDSEPGRRDPAPPYGAPDPLLPADPDHPQWVRRRHKINILFGASLATFLGVGIAAIANMVQGRPVDPYAASVMWPLGSAAAAATGLYVWQGVHRTGWPGGRWGSPRDGIR